jgi:hypothetical protein
MSMYNTAAPSFVWVWISSAIMLIPAMGYKQLV